MRLGQRSHASKAVIDSRGKITTASIKQLGARAKHGMANESESLINVVIDNKLKMLTSLTKR